MAGIDTHPGPLPPCGVGGRYRPPSIFGEISNLVPAVKNRRLTIGQLWGLVSPVREAGGANFLGNRQRVTGLVGRQKIFGAGFKNKNYPLPRIWPISLKRHFSVKKSTWPEKMLKSANTRSKKYMV